MAQLNSVSQRWGSISPYHSHLTEQTDLRARRQQAVDHTRLSNDSLLLDVITWLSEREQVRETDDTSLDEGGGHEGSAVGKRLIISNSGILKENTWQHTLKEQMQSIPHRWVPIQHWHFTYLKNTALQNFKTAKCQTSQLKDQHWMDFYHLTTIKPQFKYWSYH